MHVHTYAPTDFGPYTCKTCTRKWKKMVQMSDHGFKIIGNQPIASYEKFALKLVLITIIFTNTQKGLPGSSLELSKSVTKADRIISSKIHTGHRVPLVREPSIAAHGTDPEETPVPSLAVASPPCLFLAPHLSTSVPPPTPRRSSA